MSILSNLGRKSLVGGVAAATLAASIAVMPTTASARDWDDGGWGPGIVGGLALGALAAGAAGGYSAPAYAYPAYPAYGYRRCYIERERVWGPWGPHWRRVRVCD